ncbi:hypothetical protein DA100_04875 [Vibrio sp. Hep-1b-8]|nr:hypothetical protein DA100_04875 [Vibrio sp. Hep-1b-8]
MPRVATLPEGSPFSRRDEYFLSSIAFLFLGLTGRELNVTAIHLPYAAPEYHRQYQQRFACQVKFNQDELVLRFDAERLAVQFGCSERTLRRHLEQCCTSYQQLLNEVRADLAKEYLVGTRLTVEEIAFRLGYSDSANFRRAFKRWTGTTPQHFRA